MGDLQEIVAETAAELVGSGAERGLQVVAYVDQEPVVDVAAGVADPATGRPVEPETLFYNWSIGKGATATLVHRLVDAGVLGVDTPVAQLWPEFARHGKGAVTVGQVLNHSAGVPGLPEGVTVDDVCSWPTMIAALEDARPWWEPGTEVGYHAYTFGYLCGEIVRRATGRALGDVLDDLTRDIGHPGEIRYGMRETGGLAVLEDAPSDVDWSGVPADSPMLRAAPLTVMPTAALGADPRMLAADIPAGAKVTARALARMYAGWLGEVDGERLLSPARLTDASTVSASGEDRVYGNECRMSLGFALGLPWEDSDAPRAFGMAGAGGSWAGADPDTGLAVAVTKNVLSMDFTTVERLVGAVLAEIQGISQYPPRTCGGPAARTVAVMLTTTDVLVVGAGPAGLATAVSALRHGARRARRRTPGGPVVRPAGHRRQHPHDGAVPDLGRRRRGPGRRHRLRADCHRHPPPRRRAARGRAPLPADPARDGRGEPVSAHARSAGPHRAGAGRRGAQAGRRGPVRQRAHVAAHNARRGPRVRRRAAGAGPVRGGRRRSAQRRPRGPGDRLDAARDGGGLRAGALPVPAAHDADERARVRQAPRRRRGAAADGLRPVGLRPVLRRGPAAVA